MIFVTHLCMSTHLSMYIDICTYDGTFQVSLNTIVFNSKDQLRKIMASQKHV